MASSEDKGEVRVLQSHSQGTPAAVQSVRLAGLRIGLLGQKAPDVQPMRYRSPAWDCSGEKCAIRKGSIRQNRNGQHRLGEEARGRRICAQDFDLPSLPPMDINALQLLRLHRRTLNSMRIHSIHVRFLSQSLNHVRS
jgi:hypothetical protein